MKTLTTSSSSKLLFSARNRGGFPSPRKEFLRLESCFFNNNRKNVNVNVGGFISLQHKRILHPKFSVLSSPSLSSEFQADSEDAETRTEEIQNSKTVHVKLLLEKECLFGEEFLVVGDDPMFGCWDPTNAIPLNWSEGHVWSIELDVPIGKSIQFKFIHKDVLGNMLWQPGPDRILGTWETNNTITVVEDWEDAELQKITEEGPNLTQENDCGLISDMLIVSDNLTLPNEEQIDDFSKTLCVTGAIPDPAEMIQNEQIFAQNITQSSENPMTIVADNIAYPNEEPMTTEGTVGKNGRASALSNPAEEILDDYEGGPVLVPGLTPLSTTTIQTEEAPLQNQIQDEISIDASVGPDEAKYQLDLVPGLTPLSTTTIHTEEAPLQNQIQDEISIDASVGPDEAKYQNVPEFNEEEEEKEEVEPECIPHQEKSSRMKINGDEFQKPDLALKVSNSEVLQSDIQWGRQTLHKLLSNLGLWR